MREARLIGAQFETLLRQAEGRSLSPARFDHELIGVEATTPVTVTAKAGKTLREVFQLHQSDPSKVRTPKTVLAYENAFDVIGAVIDLDCPVRDISRDDCRHLLETLRWIPSNPTKRFPKLNIVQAAEMAKREKLTSTLSPATINAYLNRLSSVLNFAMNEGLIDRNPVRGLKVADPVRARDKRLPFSPQQLQRIFNAPIYRGCLNDETGWATPGPNHPRRGRFWAPLIGLFSGMRLNEICQLDVADIQEIESVPCFHVRPDPLAQTGKHLKTEASERLVPVSTDQQTTENQLRILNEVAERSSWTVVRVFEDAGISGAKGRDKRPGFDALLKAVHRREVDMVAAFAVDRLGRSLPDLVAFLSDIQARGCDLYLHQQAVDTSTPSGRMMFQLLSVFSEFERAMITSRVRAGIERAREKGVRFGRPSLPDDRVARVEKALKEGQSIRAVARATGVSTASVQRIKRSMTEAA